MWKRNIICFLPLDWKSLAHIYKAVNDGLWCKPCGSNMAQMMCNILAAKFETFLISSSDKRNGHGLTGDVI